MQGDRLLRHGNANRNVSNSLGVFGDPMSEEARREFEQFDPPLYGEGGHNPFWCGGSMNGLCCGDDPCWACIDWLHEYALKTQAGLASRQAPQEPSSQTISSGMVRYKSMMGITEPLPTNFRTETAPVEPAQGWASRDRWGQPTQPVPIGERCVEANASGPACGPKFHAFGCPYDGDPLPAPPEIPK